MKAIPLVLAKQKEISLFKLLGILSAVVGGIVEEVFFRRWIMDMLMSRGVAPIFQVLSSGIVFGLAHSSWLLIKRDFKFAIPAILSTSVLGILLAIIYLVGGRNLGPCIYAHVIINIVIEPWLMLSAVSGKWRTQHRLRIAAPLLAGIPEFSSGKEQVFSVKLIKESKMSQKIKEIPVRKAG
jgi:membrane protease YdiL (CAAX protease family)